MRGLGDRKPSELMDEMLALADGHSLCFLFEQLFLKQLPEDVRMQLASEDFSDPRRVALLADSIWLTRDQVSVAASTRDMVDAPRRALPRSSRAPRQRFNKQEGSSTVCFYHAKFGDRAIKCRAPCKHLGNTLAGPQ